MTRTCGRRSPNRRTAGRGQRRVLNLIQVFQKIGYERIKAAAVQKLQGLKPACYYGCLLTRPPEACGSTTANSPRRWSRCCADLGAEPVDWNYKTECCGAGMTMANEGTVLDLSHKILTNAAAHGADCIVVACPMCHVNLDMKQAGIERHYRVAHEMTIYYLSDLVGLAVGLYEKELGIDRHFVVKPVR